MKRNPYLIGADVIGQAVPSPSQPMFVSDSSVSSVPAASGPTTKPNPYFAQQAQIAAGRLATLQAALAQAKGSQAQQSAALALQLAQAGAPAPADDSSSAQTVSGYLRGADILGAVSMKAPLKSSPLTSTLRAPVSAKPISMSSGLKMPTQTSSTLKVPSSLASGLKTLQPPPAPPKLTLNPVFIQNQINNVKAEQAALAQYASTMQLPASVYNSLKANDPAFTLPAGWSVSVPPPPPAPGATGTGTTTTPSQYQWPTTGLAPTAENPNDPTHLMNGQPNPNPPNPSSPGYLMNGQPDPYAPNPSNPYVTNSGMTNPNPPNPNMPGYLMSGAIDPYYQQELAAGGIQNPNSPYGASSPYGGASYGGGDSGGGYGGDSGGGDSGGGDAGIDWGDGSPPDYGDGSGGGMDDGSQQDMSTYFDPSQTPFAMATGFTGGFGGGGQGGDDQYVDPSSFGGDQDFAQEAESDLAQENDQEANVDWGDSSDQLTGILGMFDSIIGAFDIATEQDKFNAQGPLTVLAARAALNGGLAAINNAISVANSKNLPGPTERANVLGKLNWHATAIGKLTSTPNAIYPSWQDLEKYVMDAFEDSNSVDEGAGSIDGAKAQMWSDIATAQSAREMAGQALTAISDAAAPVVKKAETAAIVTVGVVVGVVGLVGYGVYKILAGPTGQAALGTYLGRRF